MFNIRKSDEGWTIHDDVKGYSRLLSSVEIKRLKQEFPRLAEENVKTFSTNRIRSIRVRLMTQGEFDAFLRKTFGDRYKGPSERAAEGKYEVSFFRYTDEQKAEIKKRLQEGETSP